MPNVHTFPEPGGPDLIEHDVEHQDACICGPTIEAVFADDGSCGWLYTHHSLDGRELREPDYQCLPETREM